MCKPCTLKKAFISKVEMYCIDRRQILIIFHSLLVGRMYDYHILDMIELGIEKFVALRDIKVTYSKILPVPLLT